MAAAASQLDPERVANLAHSSWAAVPAAVPSVTQVLSFHAVIPVVCQTLNFKSGRCAAAVCIGSAVPLVLVLLWNGAAVVLAPPGVQAAAAASAEAAAAAAAAATATTAAAVSDTSSGSSGGDGEYGSAAAVRRRRSADAKALDPVNILLSQGGAVEEAITWVFAMSAVLTTLIGSYLALQGFFSEMLSSSTSSSPSSSLLGASKNGKSQPEEAWKERGGGGGGGGGGEVEMVQGGGSRDDTAAVTKVNALSQSSDAPDEGGSGIGDRGWGENGVSSSSSSSSSSNNDLTVAAVTVLPSAAVACIGPQVFYEVIRFSGSFIVPTLFCLAPPAMAWATRYHHYHRGKLTTIPESPRGGDDHGDDALLPDEGTTTCGCDDILGEDACLPGRAVSIHIPITRLKSSTHHRSPPDKKTHVFYLS